MIQLYTGVPGAGKTYKMVADLDDFLGKNPNINLICNIRGLKLPHTSFEDLLMECFPDKSLTVPQRIEKFFTYEHQQELNVRFGGPLMYVLDECQLYFPKRTSLPNTEAYLQRHRHLGHFLYLATQEVKLMNGNIVALIELEYYAVRRSVSLFGEMHYRVKSPQSKQILKKFAIRPKKKIFDLYKSFEAEEITKPKRELLKKLWPFLLLPLGIYVFYDRALNTDKKVERLVGKPVASASAPAPGESVPIQSGPDKETLAKMAALQQQVDELRKRLYEVERVFLMVVETSDRKLTMDPDTTAIVDIRKIKHKVVCVNDGLTCYFDRPVNSAVKVASSAINNAVMSVTSPGLVNVSPVNADAEGKAGPGAFIDEDMFEGLR